MAGTPGGGLAAGGMAGTNSPTGAIDDEIDELDDAYGEGTADISGREEVLSHPPYAGRSGGAVGGTPAEKRARGGNIGSALGDITDFSTGRESTIGGSAVHIERKKSPEKPRASKGVRRKNGH